jgi:hypothetical protein
MERVSPLNPQTAQGRAEERLAAVKANPGLVPNMTRAMAVSPPVLGAYTGFSGALNHGVMPAWVLEQLALDVGEACPACIQPGQRDRNRAKQAAHRNRREADQ